MTRQGPIRLFSSLRECCHHDASPPVAIAIGPSEMLPTRCTGRHHESSSSASASVAATTSWRIWLSRDSPALRSRINGSKSTSTAAKSYPLHVLQHFGKRQIQFSVNNKDNSQRRPRKRIFDPVGLAPMPKPNKRINLSASATTMRLVLLAIISRVLWTVIPVMALSTAVTFTASLA